MENHFSRYSKLTLCVIAFILSVSLTLTTVYAQGVNRGGGLNAWLAERGIDHDQFRKRLQEAVEVQKRHTRDLMEMSGVEGTAIGIRADGEPVFKIFTSRAGIPGIPDRLDGFSVQVEMTGKFFAYTYENPRTTLPRPVPIGVSTGHPAITAGTIGARVKDATGNVYALSNNHVYANIGYASIGDNVLQAGTADGGVDPTDAIGTLSDFEPIDFSGGYNTIDAAIALTSTEYLRNNTPDNGILYDQFTPSEEIADAFVGQQVKKYGRTSELTLGTVEDISVNVDVCYEEECFWIFCSCTKMARFINQITIAPGTFSGPGDSGSLIVTTEGNNPVGLLFAGSDTLTVANHIGPVLSRFGVTIDGDSAEPFTDISIKSVTAPASAIEGDTVDVEVVVANVGNQDITSGTIITITLEDDLDPGFAPEQTIETGLTAGESTTVTFSWNATSLGDHKLTASHDFLDDDSTNDRASSEFINVVESLIDVAVTEVRAPASVIEGDTVDVDVVVANVGNQGISSDILVTLEDDLNPNFAPEKTIEGGLAAGASTTLTFSWNATSLGDHILTASHDFVDDNSSNDYASTEVIKVVESLTDIAVTEVRAPSSVVAGGIVEVDVTVENLGNQVAENFDVTLTDTTHGPPAIGTKTVSSLAAGESLTLTYSWDTTSASIGYHTLEGSHELPDDDNTNDSSATTVEIMEQTSAGPHLWIGKRTVRTAGWETVNLDNSHDYGDKMVVVCTPNYEYDALFTPEPLVAHVQNASGSSFQVKLVQAVGGSIQDVYADVHCMVVEAGVYTLAEHGVKMEAAKFISTRTDRRRSWVGESRSYEQTYSEPVVVGQVMSLNSYDDYTVPGVIIELASAFWCRGSKYQNPPSASSLWVGKHAGEDPRARASEVIGYIVIEAGSGSIGPTNYVAALGSDSIKGVGDVPPYTYPLSGISDPSNAVAILSQAAMDGGNGSWAILYGEGPIMASGINLAVDEDMAIDYERRHTSEQVGYIVFE